MPVLLGVGQARCTLSGPSSGPQWRPNGEDVDVEAVRPQLRAVDHVDLGLAQLKLAPLAAAALDQPLVLLHRHLAFAVVEGQLVYRLLEARVPLRAGQRPTGPT